MKKVMLLLATISTWAMLMFIHTNGQTKFPFDFGTITKDGYNTLITNLRNKLKDPKVSYFEIPMLPTSKPKPTYILIELTSTQGNSITIAIDPNTIYVVGYSDKFEGKVRARFFKDAPTNAKETLFPDAKGSLRTKDIGYDGQYGSIEGKAGGDRRAIGLGIKTLGSRVDKLFGKNTKDKNFVQTEAGFLLIAIQTVSEAVRFKYIQEQIGNNFDVDHFTPDYKVPNLENKWGKLSEAIRKANSKTGEIDKKLSDNLQLVDENNKTRKVTNVNEVKSEMGLLNYVKPKLLMYQWLMQLVLGEVDTKEL